MLLRGACLTVDASLQNANSVIGLRILDCAEEYCEIKHLHWLLRHCKELLIIIKNSPGKCYLSYHQIDKKLRM